MDGTKPGYKTTEFWITLIGSVYTLLQAHSGQIPEPWGTVAVALVTAAYTVSRAIAKKGDTNEKTTVSTVVTPPAQ